MSLVPDENKGPRLVASVWACNALSTIFVALRIFTRAKLTKGLPWYDDAVIVLSLVSFQTWHPLSVVSRLLTRRKQVLGLTAGGVETAAVKAGMGRHSIYLTPSNLSRALELNTISQPFLIIGFSFPKIAVALLLFRFMGRRDTMGKYFIGFLVSSLLVLTILNSIFIFIDCDPIGAQWMPGEMAKCWSNEVTMGYNVAVVGKITFEYAVVEAGRRANIFAIRSVLRSH